MAKKKNKQAQGGAQAQFSPGARATGTERTAADKARTRQVVGPERMQLLEGTLCGRRVLLYLCGEAHEDAIDVTRKGGKVIPDEGWV